ncbi:hypothetical protein EWM64_g4593 [Hericium alpestre]|uniref:Uncharacterized protein n=1 Tax=Hericium alpestre TaxID=135208 RepID=A0A4Y9ZZ14_9AGAM|nr:hypothetical protein EWM64_g4593 [Hericium alpestre]
MRASPASSHSLCKNMASSHLSHSGSDEESSRGAQDQTPHCDWISISLVESTGRLNLVRAFSRGAGISMPRAPAELVDDGNYDSETFSHELHDRYSWRSLPEALRPASQISKVKTLEELVQGTGQESRIEILKDLTQRQHVDFEAFCTNHAADAHVHITEFEKCGLELEELMQVTLEVGDWNPGEQCQIRALLSDQQEDMRKLQKEA